MLTDLPSESRKALTELGTRFASLAGKPLKIKLRHKGNNAEETVTVEPDGAETVCLPPISA